MHDVAIFIAAAGESRRMRGRDKLLEEIDGTPLLRRIAEMALTTTCPVCVGLNAEFPARRAALAGLGGVECRDVNDAREGMSVTLRSAAHWAQDIGANGLMILLADMPELRGEDLQKLIRAFEKNPAAIWRASDESGQPGHPVILPARLYPQLARLSGDEGAKQLLAAEPPQLISLSGRRATTDLDTPEDWKTWRTTRSGLS